MYFKQRHIIMVMAKGDARHHMLFQKMKMYTILYNIYALSSQHVSVSEILKNMGSEYDRCDM